jgi:hypothetical protein
MNARSIPTVAPIGFPPVTPRALRSVARKIGELPGVEKVILFGSYARGNPAPHSDVDLLVIWNTAKSPTQRWLAVSGLFPERPFPMDIVVRTPRQVRGVAAGGGSFIREILSTGKVLFEKRP